MADTSASLDEITLQRLLRDFAQFHSSGNLDQALAVAEFTVDAIAKSNLPESAEVAAAFNNLAVVHHARGEFAAAEPVYRRVVEMCERICGSKSLETAIAISNHGMLLRSMGAFGKAEPLLERAAAADRAYLPSACSMRQLVPHSSSQSCKIPIPSSRVWHFRFGVAPGITRPMSTRHTLNRTPALRRLE